MALSRKEENRALSADERDLVARSHHPDLRDLSDGELSDTIRLVRERRDRAQSQASQKRREMRGKGAPKGTAPSRADHGSRLKLEVLAMAVRRLNSERQRRRAMAAATSLRANARKALALKKAADEQEPDFNSRHAHHGMRNNPNRRNEDLIRPMELGRQRKAASVAQARRDSA